MAVTIDATNMTLVDLGDSTTGWTSSMGGLTTESNVSREGGTNLADQASTETYNVYHTIGSASLTSHTIFGWQRQENPTDEGDATAAGYAMYLGDGTNNRSYAVGGMDDWKFFFAGWGGFRLNTAGLPTTYVQDGGGAPTLGTITRIGYGGRRPIKANGTANNWNGDVLRYCSNSNPALLIEGGTTGDRGTWANVATADDSTSNAWGICRKLVVGSNSFEVMFGLQIGSLDASSYFEDSDFQLYLNGSLTSGGTITAGSMDIDFVGWASGTNIANFDNFFIQSVGAVSNLNMSDTDIDELIWSNGQFVDIGTSTFQAQDAGNKTLTSLIWVNCGIVNFKGIDADGCSFQGATDANGAIEWDSAAVEENQDNITFVSDSTGHAIYINIDTASATTFNIDGYVFDGFAGQDGTAGNRVFYINNPSDGDITINVSNSSILNQVGTGSGFSYELAAGTTSSVTVNNNITLTFTPLIAGSDVSVFLTGTNTPLQATDSSGTSFPASVPGSTALDYKIYAKGYQPVEVKNISFAASQNVLPNQQADGNYDEVD